MDLRVSISCVEHEFLESFSRTLLISSVRRAETPVTSGSFLIVGVARGHVLRQVAINMTNGNIVVILSRSRYLVVPIFCRSRVSNITKCAEAESNPAG
jgi:hypothetical protein